MLFLPPDFQSYGDSEPSIRPTSPTGSAMPLSAQPNSNSLEFLPFYAIPALPQALGTISSWSAGASPLSAHFPPLHSVTAVLEAEPQGRRLLLGEALLLHLHPAPLQLSDIGAKIYRQSGKKKSSAIPRKKSDTDARYGLLRQSFLTQI